MLVKRKPEQPHSYNFLIKLDDNLFAIVDPDDYEKLKRFRWFAKKSHSGFYAVRKRRSRGREYIIRMHREIANCPRGLEVHHINHNRLDNRKSNLVCVLPKFHHLY